MRSREILFFILFFSFFSSGCAVMRYSEGINTLKELSASGSEINEYLIAQEEKFLLLRDKVLSGQLEKGISKELFIKKYGDPVTRSPEDQNSGKEVMLYRHPTGFFDSDRIYAVFDEEDSLESWELKPAD